MEDIVRRCAATGDVESAAYWRDTLRPAVREVFRNEARAMGLKFFGARAAEDEDSERVGVVMRGKDVDVDADDAMATDGPSTPTETTETTETTTTSSASRRSQRRQEGQQSPRTAHMCEAFERDIQRVCGQCLDAFEDDAPFTIQRICELALEPTKFYTTPYKLASAVLKLFAVTQTVDRRRDNGGVNEQAPTGPQMRDARDPLAVEQKAFVTATFQNVEDKAPHTVPLSPPPLVSS
jgi:hypothetical protein